MSMQTADKAAAIDLDLMAKIEVAKLFRVSVQTLGVWVRDGRFPSPLRIGRKLYWTSGQIRELVDRQLAEAKGPTRAA